MKYTFKAEPKEGYLHIRVTGDNTPETVLRYLREMQDTCRASGCPNVLMEEDLFGPRMSVTEIFGIIAEASRNAWPVVQRIAYVDLNPHAESRNKRFAENAASNRSVNLNVFDSVQEAEAWIVRELKPPG